MDNLSKLISELPDKKDKALRTLRNNLNNRISSHQSSERYGSSLKDLKQSHPLYGLSLTDCRDLLELVQREIKARVNH